MWSGINGIVCFVLQSGIDMHSIFFVHYCCHVMTLPYTLYTVDLTAQYIVPCTLPILYNEGLYIPGRRQDLRICISPVFWANPLVLVYSHYIAYIVEPIICSIYIKEEQTGTESHKNWC